MANIQNSIEEYNLNKKRKMLVVFGDLIADVLSNKKLHLRVTELFIRGRKLNIFLFLLSNIILL